MIAKVLVNLKDDVLDPAGRALTESLNHLGFTEVKGAKIGKLIELQIDTGDREKEKERIEDMCHKLLANPLIEDFEVLHEVEEKKPGTK
ncbi:MAG TPA: phosphoribosylformylglycinamidine synthase subunit PurS [Oligoflexia bacterium]|nr:phosphoribosylformylglycinamidine synthase subunit PurS [Oligoflexia bacterium]HMP47899.1 phosphoribosylformylglycinamidine synthase subunit PurS [Oligoflexia bacterium]